MDLHIVVLSLFGAVIVGLVLLTYRLLRHRRKVRTHDAVVSRAVAQMRQTGIFLSLGLNPDPEDIRQLQLALQPWGYRGDVDGIPNTAMLEALDRQATARGVDVESEVKNLFPTPRYAEALPESIQREIVLSTAQERLAEAPVAARHRGHRVAQRRITGVNYFEKRLAEIQANPPTVPDVTFEELIAPRSEPLPEPLIPGRAPRAQHAER